MAKTRGFESGVRFSRFHLRLRDLKVKYRECLNALCWQGFKSSPSQLNETSERFEFEKMPLVACAAWGRCGQCFLKSLAADLNEKSNVRTCQNCAELCQNDLRLPENLEENIGKPSIPKDYQYIQYPMFRYIWDQGDRQSKEIVFHAVER